MQYINAKLKNLEYRGHIHGYFLDSTKSVLVVSNKNAVQARDFPGSQAAKKFPRRGGIPVLIGR